MGTNADGSRTPRKGRGAVSNTKQRFETHQVERVDDGWGTIEEELPPLETTVSADPARSIISRNDSPDIGFEQSINPYRGCEHGCVYCYARPSHAYLNLSPGLDFETKLFYKKDAAALLEKELRKPGYKISPIMLGANTDPYQPVEKKLRVTRDILEVLNRYNHPVSIVTKGALIERDVELLGEMAQRRLAGVMISVTSLRDDIKRTLEPRTASPRTRLRNMRRLADAGVPVGVLVAPIIPVITDPEMESILEACAEAGAKVASYVLLRLPHEVKELFEEWLQAHEPLKAKHVMSLMRQMSGGKLYDSTWGVRQRGTGQFAELIAQRFKLATRRLGLNQWDWFKQDCGQFTLPPAAGDQIGLFDS
jgi:DNA repair photolyase